MKRLSLVIILLCAVGTASAWGVVGHRIIVELAKRHMTDKAKENVAKYMPYDITKDAVWMDSHRKDKPIRYTHHWHSFRYDDQKRYDINPSARRGDVVRALDIADFNLSRYKECSDSTVVMNIRMLIHFVGDMHCPSHADPLWKGWGLKVNFKGKTYNDFHYIYDIMPQWLYGKKKYIEAAAKLDTYSKGQRKKVCKGSLRDWADETARLTSIIYEWNPVEGNLREDTIEISTDMTNTQLRNAGYRLAYLLNKYFGK